MTRSARRAKRPSSAWMVDCGGLLTQPLWRPCSVAWIVASSGACARRASRSAAPPTSQAWAWAGAGSRASAAAQPVVAVDEVGLELVDELHAGADHVRVHAAHPLHEGVEVGGVLRLGDAVDVDAVADLVLGAARAAAGEHVDLDVLVD